MSDEPLDATSVVEHLRRRRLINPASATPVRELAGGVSNVTLSVGDGADRLIVKQALGTLRVAQHWSAPRRRIMTEAEALRAFRQITPGAVPRVLDVDEDALVLVIERAPELWRDWREELFAGTIRPSVARRLGVVLAAWHAAEVGSAPNRLTDEGPATFEALRVEPFHRAVARALPDTADAIGELLTRMSDLQTALVHGDFSPKNVLVDPESNGVWVIDMEVAHYGDPAFDIAFLLAHLQLKALKTPGLAVGFDALAAEFVRAYRQHREHEDWDEAHVLRHLGALLLARIHGVSPVDYLDDDAREAASRLGRAALVGEISSLEALASRRENGAP